jgi:hypothetical protein
MIEPDPDLVDELVSLSMVDYDQKLQTIEDPAVGAAWQRARPKAEAFVRTCILSSLHKIIAEHQAMHETAPNGTRLH